MVAAIIFGVSAGATVGFLVICLLDWLFPEED